VHDLAEILTELDPMLRRTLGEHVALHVDIGAGRPCRTRIDRGQLEQVVVNLAANARDAMPGGGDLGIGLGHDGPQVRLAVSDTGTGMDEEALARAFEPFYTTKPTGKGTGLGLASVYSIIRNAGGTVRLESQLGRGTTVSVYLPEPASDAPTVAEPPPVVAAPPPDGLRVLVVDDCAELAGAVGKMLRSAGYAVRVTHSPTAAVGQVADVDLLVTDVVMPEMSGPELVAAARAARPSLPVVYMSGYMPAGLDESVRLDRDAVLVEKPLTSADVLTAIGRLFAGR
jgi:CheY-like chemotaxis protein